MLRAIALTSCLLLVSAQLARPADSPLEATSLLGRKLYALPDSDGAVQAAKQKLASDPKNAALALDLSKAQAAKRQYREAIATCTAALKMNPKSAELYIEKGHRELGVREFKTAEADLRKAVRIDPKQLDAQYHLGLAYYFQRQFGEAGESFGRALDLAQSSDSVIDCTNWRYVSLRRAGQKDAASATLARITPDVHNTEPHLFFYLQLLHFYQGKAAEQQILPPKPAGSSDIEGELSFNTINYGVGNWHFYNGDPDRARQFFEKAIQGDAWNSWGFIGSEIELSNPGH